MADEKAKKCLFEELLDKKEDAINAEKRGIITNRTKRSFESARDNAIDAKQDAEIALLNLRKDAENIKDNLNDIVEHRRTVEANEELIKHICAEYQELFDEELPSKI